MGGRGGRFQIAIWKLCLRLVSGLSMFVRWVSEALSGPDIAWIDKQACSHTPPSWLAPRSRRLPNLVFERHLSCSVLASQTRNKSGVIG